MSISVTDALEQLRRAVADGEIAKIAEQFGLEIVMLFGSAAQPDVVTPGDIDVAVGFSPGAERDFLGVVNALQDVVRGDHLDVMDLDRAGPVAQKAAMFAAEPLYVAHQSVLTEREIKAFMQYEDTRWLRKLQTEVLMS